MVLLLALAVTVNAGMLTNADTLDMVFGKGKIQIINRDDDNNIDTQYYTALYATQDDARAAAEVVARQISNEGTVLLKNDGLLPLDTNQPLSPLGLGYFKPLYCGSGSSMISTLEKDVISPSEGLHAVFPHVNTVVEAAQQQVLKDHLVAVQPLDSAAEATLYEFSPAVVEAEAASLRDTVGIVYIKRQSGEHKDSHMGAYQDSTPHALALTSAEKEIIRLAREHCSGVVVVICSASPMELADLQDDPGVNAILWQGGAGSTGYASIADILCGRVNPSGRLPFTFAANFKEDPTWVNQDDGSDRFTYSNAATTQLTHTDTTADAPAPFHEYEEGVYVGYRYYETAHTVGTLADYYNRQQGVVYPFGYGLSYTDFHQEITHFSVSNGVVQLTVNVTNTGTTHAGKDVVQLYCTAPYTALDARLGIEKPAAVLVCFDKTRLLAPGENQSLKFTIDQENLASYCYTRQNPNGTIGCYMLEAGDYTLSLRSDAHLVLDSRVYQVPETIWYDTGDHIAVNHFEQMNAYMTSREFSHATILTRTDWANTQPTAPTEADRLASAQVAAWIAASDVTTAALSETLDSPAAPTGADHGLVWADLRGIPYNDALWDKLLDQLTYDDPEVYRQLLFEAAYHTGELPAINKPTSSEKDGPQGLTLADVNGKNWIDGVCGYPAAPIMAATWNQTLLYDLGAAVGQEALLKGINGWYAPGLNILRSPFCGRASEYYSEDPLLAGTLGAQVVSGAGDNGLSCAIKHFCLMETEAHRGPNTCFWMTEQALREIYLKPFEIVVKQSEKTIQFTANGDLSSRTMRAADFIMASDSAVGTTWTAASASLLTDVLRGEWGFEGTVISDIHMNGNAAMIRRLLSAGCDLLMSAASNPEVNFDSYDTAHGQALIRRAVKNLCYTTVNSGLMQGISSTSVIKTSTSPWMQALFAVDCALGLLLIAGVILCLRDIFRWRNSR